MYNKITAIVASLFVTAIVFTNNAYSFNLSKITSTTKIDSVDFKEINGKSKIFVTADSKLSSVNALSTDSKLATEVFSTSDFIAKSDNLNSLFIANNNKYKTFFNYLYNFNGHHTNYSKFDLAFIHDATVLDTEYISKTNQMIVFLKIGPAINLYCLAIANLDKNIETKFYEFSSVSTSLKLLNVDMSDAKNLKFIFSGINQDLESNSLYLVKINNLLPNLSIEKLGDLNVESHPNGWTSMHNLLNFENVNGRLISFNKGNIFEYLAYPETTKKWINKGSVGKTTIVASTTMKYTGSTPKTFEHTVFFITTEGDIYSYLTSDIKHINNSSSSDVKIEGTPISIKAVNNNLYIVSKASDSNGKDVYNIYRATLN